jgi:hypothetical protein
MNDPVKIAELQKKIANHLGTSVDDLVFDFKERGGNYHLDLITVNPTHKQSFLFHDTHGSDKVGALREMVKYIKDHVQKESTFTVQWSEMNDNELHTSYFSAHDMFRVLEKFSYGKDMNKITIFSINLNPIS